MTRPELLELVGRYRAKADRAYRSYQETGIACYDYAYRTNDYLADALMCAADAADEHNALCHLHGEIYGIACAADRALEEDADREMLEGLLRQLIGVARLYCRYDSQSRLQRGGADDGT